MIWGLNAVMIFPVTPLRMFWMLKAIAFEALRATPKNEFNMRAVPCVRVE